MASFTREQYKDVFLFAGQVWVRLNKGKGRKSVLQEQAVHVMDICEDVIGQQWYRPDKQSAVPPSKED